MSFPKAKIYRFNDVKECTPSPADYNVTPNKVKSERFTDNASISDNESSHSLPQFRTPTLPSKKKKFLPLSSPKAKLKDMFRRNDREELKEKIVELQNKDIYIKELTDEIEEIKLNMHNLEMKKIELEEDKNYKEEAIEALKKQQYQVLQELTVKHENQIELTNNEREKLKEELRNTKNEYQILRKRNEEEMAKLLENMNKFQELYEKSMEDNQSEMKRINEEIMGKEEELRKLEDENINLQKKHREEVELIQNEYSEKIRNIRQLIVASIKDMQIILEKEKITAFEKITQIEEIHRLNITDLKQKNRKEKTKIVTEYEAKLKLMEENFNEVNVLNEIQTREKLSEIEENWKLKFAEKQKESEAILRECQEISEYNIIQSEIEKNQLKNNLKEKEEKYDNLQKEIGEISELYQNLQQEITKIVVELKEARQNHGKEIESSELKQLLSEKRAYEITINNSQETIEVLKRRLINSDRDVEQLKLELADYEKKLIEYELKSSELTKNLELMTEINENKDMELESTFKIIEKQIKETEMKLMNKVDGEFKRACKETELFTEVYQQLHDQQKLNCQAQVLIKNLKKELKNSEETFKEVENNNIELSEDKQRLNEQIEAILEGIEAKKTEIRQLEEKNESLTQYCEYYKTKTSELETELEEAVEIRKKYIEQSGKYDELLQKYEMLQKENAENQKKIQETLIGSFTELKENCLLNETKETENSKYADILGQENLELQLNNAEMQNKLRGCKKTIEKLIKENSELKKFKNKSKVDKENFNSSNCSANMSFSSPGPLKEKN